MKRRMNEYVVDLTKIDGDGAFPCPHCGVVISPDDESEEVYTILDTKLKGEELEELIIQCNKCQSRIRLTGFLLSAQEL
jgi:phage terminase large subunit GpA-like protein